MLIFTVLRFGDKLYPLMLKNNVSLKLDQNGLKILAIILITIAIIKVLNLMEIVFEYLIGLKAVVSKCARDVSLFIFYYLMWLNILVVIQYISGI